MSDQTASRTGNENGDRIGVMHLVDTLDVGGAEQVAVSLANLMPRDRYRMYVCSTRYDGPLADRLNPDVGRICLGRRRVIEWQATRRLVSFIRSENIQILHAHSMSILTANLAAVFSPRPAMVWHAHWGLSETYAKPYRLLTRRARAVIVVSRELAQWSSERLKVPQAKIHYVPNFVADPPDQRAPVDLPGKPGKRILNVANLRPEKDHPNLLRAFKRVLSTHPDAHLLLVGTEQRGEHLPAVQKLIADLDLHAHVSLLGQRNDARAIMAQCDVAAMSSYSEGLPISLLEYGAAGLSTVVTDTGQCAEVVDQGGCGVVVPPRDSEKLGDAISDLLSSPARSAELGQAFRQRIANHYSGTSTLRHIEQIYARAIGGGLPFDPPQAGRTELDRQEAATTL